MWFADPLIDPTIPGLDTPQEAITSSLQLHPDFSPDVRIEIFGDEEGTLVVDGRGDEVRNDLIGRASVSMEGQGQFVIAATFDENGERLEATQFQRTPVDFNDVAGQEISCDETLAVLGSVAVRVGGQDR